MMPSTNRSSSRSKGERMRQRARTSQKERSSKDDQGRGEGDESVEEQSARESAAHTEEVLRYNEDLIAQLQAKMKTKSREETVQQMRRSIMRASQLCSLLHEFTVLVVGNDEDSSLQVNESEEPPLVSLVTRGLTVAYGSLPDCRVRVIGQDSVALSFSQSEVFALNVPDAEDKQEILDIFDGSDILLEVRGKLEKKVAIGWDLHDVRLQCTKLFYCRVGASDSNREEKYIELPNTHIQVDSLADGNSREVIVITDHLRNKTHRFRLEVLTEKRKESQKSVRRGGTFAQWSALIQGFHSVPDAETNDVRALVLSMKGELLNLEKEFRNASKFKKLEELIGKLNSIGTVSLEAPCQDTSAPDTMNRPKKKSIPVSEPTTATSRGEVQTMDSSNQTEKSITENDTDQKANEGQIKFGTTALDRKEEKELVLSESGTQTPAKKSRTTSVQTDSMESGDESFVASNNSSHNTSVDAEVPDKYPEKDALLVADKKETISEVQDSKNDKEKTSNDPKPNYDSCEAKKDDISQSSDELSQATEQQKLVVLCDQQTSATVESKESENKDSETVSDEQVVENSSKDDTQTESTVAPAETSEGTSEELPQGSSQNGKTNQVVGKLKERFEKGQSESSSDVTTEESPRARERMGTGEQVKDIADKLKDLKLGSPCPVQKKLHTPTTSAPPVTAPPPPGIPIPPPPMPPSAGSGGKDKKKSSYKGPKLKPIHWEGTKLSSETKAMLEEAERNGELLSLTEEDKLQLQSLFVADPKNQKRSETKVSSADRPDSSKLATKTEKTGSSSSVRKKPALNLDIDTARKLEFFLRENRTNKNPLFSEEKKGLHHFLLVFFKKDDSDKEKEFVRQLQSFLPKEEKQLKIYKDVREEDLHLVSATERQMLILCQTPEIIKKVQILGNLARISEEASLIEQNIEACIAACNQILGSCKQLNLFLKLLVESGNYLNEGATGSNKNKIDTLDLVKALPNISNMKTKEQLLPFVMNMAKQKSFDITRLANEISVGHQVSFLTSLAGTKPSSGSKNTTGFSILRIPLESLSVLIEKTAQTLNIISRNSKNTDSEMQAGDEQLFLESCKSFLDEKGRFKSIPAQKNLDDLEILYRTLLQNLSLKENTCPCEFFDTIDSFSKKLKQLLLTA